MQHDRFAGTQRLAADGRAVGRAEVLDLQRLAGDAEPGVAARHGGMRHDGSSGLAANYEFDVIILDIMMPGVDGYEICYLIKTAQELQHARVVILTSRDDADGISTGREAFADAYLLKPFDPGELLSTIRKLKLGQRIPFPVAKRPRPDKR